MEQYYWQKDSKYYRLSLLKDLFGELNLICSWGRIGTRLGGYKIIICRNQTDLDLQIDKIKKRRKNHGYQLIRKN